MAIANDSLKDLLNQMEGFISTKTVVGDPVNMGDMIILPLVDVSLGVGAGARGKEKANGIGGAVGAKMSPSAVLVVKEGSVRLVSIKNNDAVSKVLDMVPDVIDKITGKNAAEDEAVKKAAADQLSDKQEQ